MIAIANEYLKQFSVDVRHLGELNSPFFLDDRKFWIDLIECSRARQDVKSGAIMMGWKKRYEISFDHIKIAPWSGSPELKKLEKEFTDLTTDRKAYYLRILFAELYHAALIGSGRYLLPRIESILGNQRSAPQARQERSSISGSEQRGQST